MLYDLDSGGILGPRDDPRVPVALSRVEGGQIPSGWRLRQRCGGIVPEPLGDDPATQVLTLIARDAFCILLSPPDLTINSGLGRSLPASDPLIGMSQSVMAHPRHAEAQSLLTADAGDWEEVIVHSALSSTPLSKAPTPESVIRSAAERWGHLPDADVLDFMRSVAECLADLRQLGEGESIKAPAVIGLRGLNLVDEGEHELPIGVLRPPTESERRFSPFMEVGAEVETVLATSIELYVSSVSEQTPRDLGQSQLELVEIGRAISLASALARRTQANQQSTVSIAWITEATPLQGSGAFKPGPISDSYVPSIEYGTDEIEALVAWIERVRAADLSHVEIAVERLLRALFEVEGGELLIDAVIAWENLLGTRSETVYRVTAGLAVLCEDDHSLRLERRKEFQGIYDKRSRMVHGDSVGADFELRNRAIQIGLEALARLIEDRPVLLGLAKSQERVDRLLLGVDDVDSPAP